MSSRALNLREFLLDRRTAHVRRWHHRPVIMEESIATHQALTARIAYFVTVLGLKHRIFETELDASRLVISALFHDEAEIITGDHPGNQKQEHDDLRQALLLAEEQGIIRLTREAPHRLSGPYVTALSETGLGDEGRQVLRYADDLAALAFLEDEIRMGNRQESVRDTHLAILKTIAGRSWPWLKALRLVEVGLP